MAATISDVAKEAGVSTSTVSKVLNNWSSISPETCARVHAAIEKLHYTPNARAVSFARGATRNIIFLSAERRSIPQSAYVRYPLRRTKRTVLPGIYAYGGGYPRGQFS